MRRLRPLYLLFILITGILTVPSGFAGTYLNGDPGQPYIPEEGVFAPNEAVRYLPLSGKWSLQQGKSVSEVTVPGCWPASDGAAVLERTFDLPETAQGKHIRLVFWGAEHNLTIRINDRLVEAWSGDWNTVVVDLSNEVLNFGGENRIKVEIDGFLSPRSSIPLKPRLFDSLPYAGLFRDVALIIGPDVLLERMIWSVDLSDNMKEARWEMRVVLKNTKETSFDSSSVRNIFVRAEWASPDGKVRGESNEILVKLGPVEAVEARVNGVIRNPRLWSPDNPELYDFVIMVREGESVWTWRHKAGMARIDWSANGLSINGKHVPLRGIDVSQEIAGRGIAMSVEEIENDLMQIKRLGFNLVRFTNQPHPVTASICDRIGLLMIPHTGLRNVPDKLFMQPSFEKRLSTTLHEFVKRDGNHVSVVAWGVADGLSGSPGTLSVLERLVSEQSGLDNRPLLAGFMTTGAPRLPDGVIGLRLRPPYFYTEPFPPLEKTAGAWLQGGLGAFASTRIGDDSKTEGQIRQADALLFQLEQVRKLPVAGFVIDNFADRISAWPMMISGAAVDPAVVERGLKDQSRSERIALRKIANAFSQPRIDVPPFRAESGEFPIVFPISALVILGALLITRRQNNVFRQNLNRVFAHTHGFFVDIRDRRYFQVSQTILIAVVLAVSQGILVAAWFYHAKDSFLFDYLLTLLLPVWPVKKLLVLWAWNPVYGVAGFAVLHFLLLMLASFGLRLLSLPLHGRLSFKQSFNMVTWGASNFLLLTPLGLVQYRLLDHAAYRTFILIVIAIFTLWYLLRVSSMFRIAFRISVYAAWGILFLVFIAILISVGSFLESSFAIMENIDHFFRVIVPWVEL